jgi:PAS domain-containing protein
VALKIPIVKTVTLAVPLALGAGLWAFMPSWPPEIVVLLGVGVLLWGSAMYWLSAMNKRCETELQLNFEKLLLQCAELEDTNDRVNKEANDHAVIAEELLLARHKIKESERQYQTLMEVVHVGICHITPEGKLLYTNPPARPKNFRH